MSRDATLALCIEWFGAQYAGVYKPVEQVRRTLWRLQHCRTGAMGSRTEVCEKCGYGHEVHNSCRDRHCPACQGANRAEWTMRRKQELLPVTYFHVVFTLPECLNPTMLAFRTEAFASLFEAASQTLKAFGEKHGVQLGVTAVLHTWGSALAFHPHLHCIVTGGGADLKTGKWKCLPWAGRKRDGAEPFLFPVRALSKVFRAKFMDSFSARLQAKGAGLEGSLREECFSREWCVYAKSPVCGAGKVVDYLARYSYRIAISNDRILGVGGQNVTFLYRDYRNSGRNRAMTIDGVEFIRRFAMHILPAGFMRIRHYGILAACSRKKLAGLQAALGAEPLPPGRQKLKAAEAMALGGKPLKACPVCGCAMWRVVRIRSPAA